MRIFIGLILIIINFIILNLLFNIVNGLSYVGISIFDFIFTFYFSYPFTLFILVGFYFLFTKGKKKEST